MVRRASCQPYFCVCRAAPAAHYHPPSKLSQRWAARVSQGHRTAVPSDELLSRCPHPRASIGQVGPISAAPSECIFASSWSVVSDPLSPMDPLRPDQKAKTSLWKEMPCLRQARSAIAVSPGGPQTNTCGLRPAAMSPLVEGAREVVARGDEVRWYCEYNCSGFQAAR